MLLFIHDTMRHMDNYIFKYKFDALENSNDWNIFGEKELGKPVNRYQSDDSSQYTSKMFAEYV